MIPALILFGIISVLIVEVEHYAKSNFERSWIFICFSYYTLWSFMFYVILLYSMNCKNYRVFNYSIDSANFVDFISPAIVITKNSSEGFKVEKFIEFNKSEKGKVFYVNVENKTYEACNPYITEDKIYLNRVIRLPIFWGEVLFLQKVQDYDPENRMV